MKPLDDLLRDHAIVRRADRLCYELEAEGFGADDAAMVIDAAARINRARQAARASAAAEPDPAPLVIE
jgi:hypothetical protein